MHDAIISTVGKNRQHGVEEMTYQKVCHLEVLMTQGYLTAEAQLLMDMDKLPARLIQMLLFFLFIATAATFLFSSHILADDAGLPYQ
jgi:hypothetical protein